MSPVASNSLLSPTELRLLEGMRLTPQRVFSGRVSGERISRKKGTSIEFADYRDYMAGDDLRHLDWNILARLDRPSIRTYQDEDDLAVYIALDVSRSMDFGEPTKFDYAVRLTAALGYIALIGQDALYPIALGGAAQSPGRALRGRGNFRLLMEWLNSLQPEGERSLTASLTLLSKSRSMRPGLFLCFTDGLSPQAGDALRAIASRGHEVALIQILSATELDPDIEGDIRLLDAENGEPVEITANEQTLRAYKENLANHCRLLKETSLRVGGRYLQCVAGQSLSDLALREIQRIGLAKLRY